VVLGALLNVALIYSHFHSIRASWRLPGSRSIQLYSARGALQLTAYTNVETFQVIAPSDAERWDTLAREFESLETPPQPFYVFSKAEALTKARAKALMDLNKRQDKMRKLIDSNKRWDKIRERRLAEIYEEMQAIDARLTQSENARATTHGPTPVRWQTVIKLLHAPPESLFFTRHKLLGFRFKHEPAGTMIEIPYWFVVGLTSAVGIWFATRQKIRFGLRAVFTAYSAAAVLLAMVVALVY
jgi:hypothetical protein